MQQMDMKFAWIPPGTVSRDGSVAVISKGFYMGIYPVTQAQFLAVMGFNPSYFTGDVNRPVEMVNWFDAQDFCKKLGDITKKPIRLLTEAEWEYACRAGDMDYQNGNGDAALKLVGCYSGNSAGKTKPVGQFPPNVFGICDMHGNVFEWCSDNYGEYEKPRPVDPQGPASTYGDYQVQRGGSWGSNADHCRAACRDGSAPAKRNNQIGFRVCFGLK